ncbi:MAG: [FeFe] hydrogenase, group A [Alphaproteobacteria bacterium]|nr:[FeFe] hydrogenase, group A [Alphaproteobacteria bacterium]
MTMVTAKIDGVEVKVSEGTSILAACKSIQVNVPTLCWHPDLCATGACGICLVKVKGKAAMIRACCVPLEQGMEVTTRDPELVKARRTVVELILSKHPNECLTCSRNGSCELQSLAADFGIEHNPYPQVRFEYERDESTKAVVLDQAKCVMCGRCVDVCQNMQNVWALCFMKRSIHTQMSPPGGIKLEESPCIKCGQCSAHCPVGAIVEYDQTQEVLGQLVDPDLYCVVQIAPAVRVAIGEAFGNAPGNIDTGKLYAALRRLGFKGVFDTNFGADVTIMEEATEFVQRFRDGQGKLPLITSCCPAWVDFMEKYYPDMIGHFSTCKSPHAIVGTLAKTYWAQKNGIDPAKIRMVSIMPCTAKKYEIRRHEKDMYASGYQDVDISLTTRELARMIKQAGIAFNELPDETPDALLGEYTGAGTIFGRTGGVMEAALRTAHFMLTGENPGSADIKQTQGTKGIRSFELDVKGTKIRIGIAHGTGNVEALLKEVEQAAQKGEEPPYHFIEVMACMGGCAGGGGQPRGVTSSIRIDRGKGLNKDDKQSKTRFSHENEAVKKLYDEFLEHPCSQKAHELLHTSYSAKQTYKR